jgi:hypothetical protein
MVVVSHSILTGQIEKVQFKLLNLAANERT